MNTNMACTEERSSALAELASGRLSAAEGEELFEHVSGCAECSVELDVVSDLVAALDDPVTSMQRRASIEPWRSRLFVPLVAAASVIVTSVLWIRVQSTSVDYAELADLRPLPAVSQSLRGSEVLASGPAFAAYREQRWSDAAAAFESWAGELAPDDPAGALPSLYLGIVRLQLGEAAAAAAPLERAAASGVGLVAQRGAWYLASVHLLRGDAEAARTVLQSIVDGGGDYALDARDRLDGLERLAR